MRKIVFLLVLTCTLYVPAAFSQRAYNSYHYGYARNAAFTQAAISKFTLYALGFEHVFHVGDELAYSYGGGLGYSRSRLYIPVELDGFATPESVHHMEISAIGMPSADIIGRQVKSRLAMMDLVGLIGYRYQDLDRPGIFVKVGAGPRIMIDPNRTTAKGALGILGYGRVVLGFSF